MAMGRVWGGFFDTQTQPVRPPLYLNLACLINGFFFNPKLTSSGPRRPRPATSGPNLKPLIHGPIQPNLKKKKKKKINFYIFLMIYDFRFQNHKHKHKSYHKHKLTFNNEIDCK